MRRVVITGPPPVQVLDVSGPLEVFSNSTAYDIVLATPEGGNKLRTSRGIDLRNARSLADCSGPIARVTAGVEMDVLGIGYHALEDATRDAIVERFPRTSNFKEDILQAFYHGIKHKPATTFGNVKADVLADKDRAFRRTNFCSIIRDAGWKG